MNAVCRLTNRRKSIMSKGSERKLPIISAFVFLMLAMIGFIFYQSTVSSQQALEWQRHSQDIIYRLDQILYLTLDSEASVRGFTLVASDTYLEPHRKAEQQIRANLSYLRQRFAPNKPQLDELSRLEAFNSEYFTITTDAIATRSNEGVEAAQVKFSPQRVKSATDPMRVSIEKLKADEASLLERRQKGLSDSLYLTIWILIVATFAGAGALVLANIFVVREFKKRRSAETALVEANEGLEEKVKERTNLLEHANEALVDVGAERERLLIAEQSARREAEIANRLRDEFMATVSHELRTPLNSILGWARLLKDGDLDQPQIDKAIATIIRSSENQNRLIEDLLDAARLISGKLELELTDLKIRELAEHSVESLRPTAGRRNIKLSFESDGASDVRVNGDRNRLVQVFSNLIENAIKFSDEGGKIFVSMAADGDTVSVTVRDNGAGISSEFLPQVFERFRQDSERSGTDNAGLGLGLAIVRNLVEMHNGSVSAHSDGIGKGSQFRVTLPLSGSEPIREADDVSHDLEQVRADDVRVAVE